MLKLARRARGHFMTLIEIRVHLIRCKPGHISCMYNKTNNSWLVHLQDFHSLVVKILPSYRHSFGGDGRKKIVRIKPDRILFVSNIVFMRLPRKSMWSTRICVKNLPYGSYQIFVDGTTYRRDRRDLLVTKTDQP